MTRKLHFRKIERVEFGYDMERLGLQAPRRREGREIGFSFWANGLTVIVWTTVLDPAGPAREEDSGWVLIKEGDRVRYFSHPLRRTEGFLRNLYRYARACRERVLERPRCPVCKKQMNIEYGKALGQRYWACFNRKFHEKPEFATWDHGLSKQSRDFFKVERRERRRYYGLRRAQGKPLHVARLKRVSWKTTRSENRIPAR